MRTVVTGGGTGGHLFPGLAVAESLHRLDPQGEIRFIGGSAGMEAGVLPDTGLAYSLVASRRLVRLASPGTLLVAATTLRGYIQARNVLKRFRPNVLISTGGYTAAATAMAAARMHIPTILLEYNAVPGRTNLWLKSAATCMAYWLDETAGFFKGCKLVRTGVPLRREILRVRDHIAARQALGISTKRHLILVLGGSQGSQHLNGLVVQMVGNLSDEFQVLHLTGPRKPSDQDAAAPTAALNERYDARPFLDAEAMGNALCAADIVICRAGISTLAEAASCGLPALMVPLPTAYADHQTANSKAIERCGAGISFRQAELSGGKLAGSVMQLVNEPGKLDAMVAACRAIGARDGAEAVARLAAEIAR